MPAEAVMKPEGLRLAHSDGFTDICFSQEDARLISGGDDGYANIWSTTDNGGDDNQTTHQLGDSVSCLSIHKDLLHAVVASSTLSEFDYPSCSFKRICLKLSDNITHFAANSSYSTLAVAASDFKIRLLDRESLSIPTSLTDHQAPVLSVAFSSGIEELLASSSCDSTVRLWSTKEGKCISTFGRVLPKSNDVANSPTQCRLQFSKDGTRLYAPTEGEIKVYDVRNWHKPCEKIDLPKKCLVSSAINFSRNGDYFAAICKDVLAVYSISKSHWVARMNHSKPLCVAVWHPFTANRLAFTDNRGQLGFVTAPIESSGSANVVDTDADMVDIDDAALMLVAAELGDDDSMSSPAKDTRVSPAVSKETAPKKLTGKDSAPSKAALDTADFSDDDDSLKGKKAKSHPPKKAESKKASKKKFDMSDDESASSPPLAMEEDKEEDDDPITDLGRIRSEFKEFFDDEEDDDDDDSENSKPPPASKDGKSFPANTSTPSAKAAAGLQSAGAPAVSTDIATMSAAKPVDVHLQKAFQVASTPAGRGGQNSRFLVWNQLGVVRLYESPTEDGESSVEAEFHDTSVHPPISLSSSDEFILAALSADVLVLASISASNDEDDEGASNCRLRVLTLSAWDSSREWLCDLPSGEICVSIAVGNRWIAVVTDKQLVRLFSLAGFQFGIVSLAGPAVTAAGSGDSLLVTYHNGVGAFGNQNISFDLYKMAARLPKLVASGALPITPKSTLTWAGFGYDYGTVFTCDSSSMVRAFSLSNRNWTPVAHLRRCGQIKSRADHYWVVGISEKQQQIYSIFCKASTYPAVLPRPILSTVPLGVPVCDAGTDGAKLADEAIRLRLLSAPSGQPPVADAEMKLQETLMRLFAIALKQERQFRAAEIAESMQSSHAIQLAGKYAARLRLGHLADVLNELALKRTSEFEQPEDDFSSFPTSSDYGTHDRISSSVTAPSYSDRPFLPVLATPPIVTLVKRPPAGTPALNNDFASSNSASISRAEVEKDSTKNIPADSGKVVDKDDDDDDDDDVEEIEMFSEKAPPKVDETAPKAAKVNPFKSRQSTDAGQAAKTTTTTTPGDALSFFERVEPQRPKAAVLAPPAADSSRKKKATAQSRKSSGGATDGEDGPAAPKKKRTTVAGSKRKSSGIEVDTEGSKSSNVENEDSSESVGNRPASSEDSLPEKALEKDSDKDKKKAAPSASTLRKLTDFMFSKN